MLDGELPRTIGAKPVSTRLMDSRGSPADKLVDSIKAAGEFKTAMAIRNQDTGLDRVYFGSNDGHGYRRTGLAVAADPVRDKSFLFYNPEHPVDFSRPRLILGKDQDLFMLSVSTLHDFKYLTVLSPCPGVMEYTIFHLAYPTWH